MSNTYNAQIGFKPEHTGSKSKSVKVKSGKGTNTGEKLGFQGGKTKKKGYSTSYNVKKLTEPKDTKRFDKMSIVFFDNKVLNDFTKLCLPKAGGSEFQVHYRALTIHIQKDEFEVIVTIPTAYYNFKQEVSSGAVDWELDDRDKEAEKVKEVSDINAAALIQKMPFFHALDSAGYDVSFREGDFGSIHRHPGRFGFSSIDLMKDSEDPGIIYRNRVAVDVVQTDSVMYIGNDKDCEIYTTEARIVNVKKAKDGGVEGDYCQIPTISIIRPEERAGNIVDPAAAVLGSVDSDIFSKFHMVGAFGVEIKKYPMLEIILEMLDSLEYNVCIENIDADRITQKFSYVGKYSGKSTKKYGNYYDDMDVWDDMGYGDYNGSYYGYGGIDGGDEYDYYKNKLVKDSEYNAPYLDAAEKNSKSEVGNIEMQRFIQEMLDSYGVEWHYDDIFKIRKVMGTHFTEDEQYAILDYGTVYDIAPGEEVMWNGW